MNNSLLLLVSLIIPWAIGNIVLTAISGRKYFPTNLFFALAYGLGIGILTQVMLVLGILKIPFSTGTISLALIVVALIALLCSRMRKKNYGQMESFSEADTPLSSAQRIFCFFLLIFIAYPIAYVFWQTFNVPVYAWDVIATIAFKAKVFFYEKGLVPLHLLPHSAYPLHVPLLQTWVALNLGQWDDQAINIILPFTFCSFLTIYYCFLKSLTEKTWAIVGTALLVSSLQFVFYAIIPYRELFVTYYNCTAIMLLIMWQRKQCDDLLILAGLFSGFMTFVKLETMGYLGIHFALLGFILLQPSTVSFLGKIKKSIKFAFPSLFIFFLYYIYKIFAGGPVTEKMKMDFSWANLDRIPQIFGSFINSLFFGGYWNILWFLLLVSFINLLRGKCSRETQGLTITLGMFFGLYMLVGFLSMETFTWMVPPLSHLLIPRVILHFYPLAPILIILLNFPARSPENLK